MKLQQTLAIVTGGASGLGEATCRRFSAAGCKIAIFDLQDERGAQTAQSVGGLYYRVDVTDESTVGAALRDLFQQSLPPRILVNCAGFGIARKVVGRDGVHPLDLFRRVIEVNLLGTFNTTRLFADHLSKIEPHDGGERGVVINTASVAAHEGQMGQAAYAAAKAGVAGLTLPLARDLAKLGIRVCTISPGLFWTPPAEHAPAKTVEMLSRLFQFPARFGQPDEYAALAQQICENSMLNGTVLRLDGGVRLS